MSARIFIEGAHSKEQQSRCREAFSRLFAKAGFGGRMPRLIASGGRNSAFDDFRIAFKQASGGDFIALLVDSEGPVQDLSRPWTHLQDRDQWRKPTGATEDHVFLMITSMETWIVADRDALREHYGNKLQENALPPVDDLERRSRNDVFERLSHATRECSNAYRKGKRSFEIVGKLDPPTLIELLPGFGRMIWILNKRL